MKLTRDIEAMVGPCDFTVMHTASDPILCVHPRDTRWRVGMPTEGVPVLVWDEDQNIVHPPV
jgi:hypothetical protein